MNTTPVGRVFTVPSIVRDLKEISMGVMRCYRKGCENILCDRYSEEFGYICSDCYIELLKRGITKKKQIRKFMNETRKELNKLEEVEKKLSSIFIPTR